MNIKITNNKIQREELPEYEEDERDDKDEEEPVVVVLKDGDLTAEEADAIKKQQENGKKTLNCPGGWILLSLLRSFCSKMERNKIR